MAPLLSKYMVGGKQDMIGFKVSMTNIDELQYDKFPEPSIA
jgi:hypothetical protein